MRNSKSYEPTAKGFVTTDIKTTDSILLIPLTMNNVETSTSIKVIRFGKHVSSSTLETIRGYGYDGVSVLDANDGMDILPSKYDRMTIILVEDNEEAAAECARKFYQAGVLTIAITCNDRYLPEDCCDTQTNLREAELTTATEIFLNVILNKNGYVCLDFNDLLLCLKDSKTFALATLYGFGDSRIKNALSHAKEHLYGIEYKNIDNLIIAVYFNKDSERPLVMDEAIELTSYIASLPKEVNVIFGLYHDESIVDGTIYVKFIISGTTCKSKV